MSHLIVIDPAIRSGEPCLRGTRLTVNDVISIVKYCEEGEYNLTKEEIDACFAYHVSTTDIL